MCHRRSALRWEATIKLLKISRLGSLIVILQALNPAHDVLAGELRTFNEQVASAYAPYRSAMFYLRTGNPDVAYLDLDAAQAAWQSVVERFGEAPPDAFVDDENFGDTLTSVQKTLETSQSLIDKNDQTAAMDMLASVRQKLAALRSRNGIRSYSDCIDEMNASMDRLWIYRHEPPSFDEPDQVNAVKRAAAITDYLYRRCYETASLELQSDEAFKRMFEGSLVSLPLIYDALDQANEAMLINILRELRSFDRMIWLEFG